MNTPKITMPEDQKRKCDTIIHGASVAAGGAGSGLAQVPMADSAIITPIQIGMIIALGKVFDQEITKSTASAILSSMAASFAGRTASQLLVGWLPLFGNAINAATAAGLTELVGWNVAEQFYKNQINDIGYEVYAGEEYDQDGVESNFSDKNEPKYRQFEARAEAFLCGQKTKKENREEYNTLLNDIEYELEDTSDDHLLAIYDQLLSGKVTPKKEPSKKEPHFSKDEQIGDTEQAPDRDNRACELKLYDVFALEDEGKYRVTAKINYAPIHVGDSCARLDDGGEPTDERITVLQIGLGDRQWTEKEPDKITTLIISSQLKSSSKLTEQRFICME